MNSLELSEIITGLVIDEKLDARSVPTHYLTEIYRDAVILIREKGADKTKLYDKIGAYPIKTAVEAAEDADPKVDYLKLLEDAYSREELGVLLEREAKKLKLGKEIDYSRIASALQRKTDYSARYKTLDTVPPLKNKWRKSFYEPLDLGIGGYPEGGLVVVGAPPSTGKTSLMIKLAAQAAKNDKRVLLISLEMLLEQIKTRFIEIEDLKPEQYKNITCTDDNLTLEELEGDIPRMCLDGEYYLICIDFADLLLTKDEDEQSVGSIYRSFAKLSKRMKVPILLLSQLSRSYVGGIPRIHHLRWSGLAEAMASLILLLYNPNRIYADQGQEKSNKLVPYDDQAYIIAGKSRYGFKGGGGICALRIGWDDGEGTSWGDELLEKILL